MYDDDDADDVRGNTKTDMQITVFFPTPIINCINTTTSIIYLFSFLNTSVFFRIAYFSIITKSNAVARECGFLPIPTILTFFSQRHSSEFQLVPRLQKSDLRCEFTGGGGLITRAL